MDDGKFIDFSLRKCRIKSVSADNTLIVEDEDGKEEKASYKLSMICVDKKLEKVKNVHEFVELFDRLSSRIFYATIFSDLDSDLKKVRHIWTGDDFDSVSDSPDATLEQQLRTDNIFPIPISLFSKFFCSKDFSNNLAYLILIR